MVRLEEEHCALMGIDRCAVIHRKYGQHLYANRLWIPEVRRHEGEDIRRVRKSDHRPQRKDRVTLCDRRQRARHDLDAFVHRQQPGNVLCIENHELMLSVVGHGLSPEAGTEQRARTSALTRCGLPLRASTGHHKVRARANARPSARRISVKRSKLKPSATPTQVRTTISSPSTAGLR